MNDRKARELGKLDRERKLVSGCVATALMTLACWLFFFSDMHVETAAIFSIPILIFATCVLIQGYCPTITELFCERDIRDLLRRNKSSRKRA